MGRASAWARRRARRPTSRPRSGATRGAPHLGLLGARSPRYFRAQASQQAERVSISSISRPVWDLRTWTSDTLRDVGSAQRVSLADATQMMNEIASMNACNYDWPREGPIAIARPRREAGRRPNRACAVCVLHHQLAECNPAIHGATARPCSAKGSRASDESRGTRGRPTPTSSRCA